MWPHSRYHPFFGRQAPSSLLTDEIAEMLHDYERVDSIADVPLDTHVRYFSTAKDGAQIFRTGGILKNSSSPDSYVILRNSTMSWSVLVKDTIFFRKVPSKERLAARDETIAQLRLELASYVDQIRALKVQLDEVMSSGRRYAAHILGTGDSIIIGDN